MPRPLVILDQNVISNALKELAKLKEIGTVSNRSRAISIAGNSGIKTVSEVFDINPSSLHRWIIRFKKDGVEGLIKIKKNQGRSLLSQQDLLLLKSWIEKKSQYHN